MLRRFSQSQLVILNMDILKTNIFLVGNSLRSRNLPEVPKRHVARLLQQAVTYEDNVPLITHDPSNTLLSVLVEFENQGTTVQTTIGRVVGCYGMFSNKCGFRIKQDSGN